MNLQPRGEASSQLSVNNIERLLQKWRESKMSSPSLSPMKLFLGGRNDLDHVSQTRMLRLETHHRSSPESDPQDCSHLLIYPRGCRRRIRTSWQHNTSSVNEARSNHNLRLPVTGQTSMMVPKIWQVHNLRRILRDTHPHSQPASQATVRPWELAQDMSNRQRTMMMKDEIPSEKAHDLHLCVNIYIYIYMILWVFAC